MKFIYWIVFLFCGAILYAQNTPVLEAQYQRLSEQRQLLTRQADSLNALLQTRVLTIERRKQKGSKASKLEPLTAEAFQISRQLQTKKEHVAALDQQLAALRLQLYARYTQKIDSLKAKEKNRLLNASELQLLSRLVYKRLLYTPQLPPLPFDPEQIIRIDLKHSKDSLESAILRNYLSETLQKIDHRLRLLEQKEEEVRTMARLQTKREDFLDDVSEGPLLAPAGGTEVKAMSENNPRTDDQMVSAYADKTSDEQINLWLSQLSVVGVTDKSAGRSMRDYNLILKELTTARENLETLRRMIRQKLNQSKKTK